MYTLLSSLCDEISWVNTENANAKTVLFAKEKYHKKHIEIRKAFPNSVYSFCMEGENGGKNKEFL